MKSFKAISVIEILLASAIFTTVALQLTVLVLQALDSDRISQEKIIAQTYATEGLEAVRSIRNQNFADLINTPATGLIINSGVWDFFGTSNSFQKYQRVISIFPVNRDGSGNIVSTGGTLDPDTKKVVSTVTWNFSPTRNLNTTYSTYLTNWQKSIGGNWALPTVESTLNLPNSPSANGVSYRGSYAFVTRSTGSPNFYSIDISNTASPISAGTANLDVNPAELSHTNNNGYFYVASSSNTRELQVVDATNPLSPSVSGNFNAAGNVDGMGVFSVGSTVYLSRVTSTDPEIYVINASNPSSPSSTGSAQAASGNVQTIYVQGGYAYAGTTADSAEILIYNLSSLSSSPVSLNLTGNADVNYITGFTNTLVVARSDGSLDTVNISTPTSPVVLGTYAGDGGIAYSVTLNSDNSLAFMATSATTTEFKVIDLANLSSPSLYGSYNFPATLYDVIYDADTDRVYAATANSGGEFAIFMGQ